MTNKKLLMVSIAVSLLLCNQHSWSSEHEAKSAIKDASRKVVWSWAKSRSLPFVAGAALAVVPPIVAAAGFMNFLGGCGPGMTERQSNTFMGMFIGGWGLSLVGVPMGTFMMGRQTFLIGRDLHLFNKLTQSTARLHMRSLPTVAEIQRMNNHDQLLTAGTHYLKQEGNIAEWLPFVVPGFKGYKTVKP